MPVYEYIAINPRGKSIKGTVEADGIRGARQRLRAKSIFPTQIQEANVIATSSTRDIRRYFRSQHVSLKDLAVSTRQLATLVSAGLPLVSALQSLASLTEAPVLRRILTDIRESVEEGTSLAKAMAAFPKSFPRLYVNMIASGEASGKLDAVLENLADYLEAQLELRRKITSALFYPALMLCFCTLVIVALLTFVVPNIVEIFTKQNAVLPLPTQILIVFSDFLVHYWYLLILSVVILFASFRWYYQQDSGRASIDRTVLKIPLYGPLFTKVTTARVARTLGTLLGSGVGLLTALDVTRNIVANVHFREALENARDGVREGRSLAKELNRSGLFPALLSNMIGVGEQSGELESMLAKAGQAYERDVNATLSGLTALIEPVMIIGLGGIVFAIVMAVLMPMVDMINLVQG